MDAHDPLLDHRARLERTQFEAAERRDRARIDQRSQDRSAESRVSTWEQLHDLRLPKDSAHPILRVVAQQTALELSEVLEVQLRRAQPAAGVV
jgi:hypothetical protein